MAVVKAATEAPVTTRAKATAVAVQIFIFQWNFGYLRVLVNKEAVGDTYPFHSSPK